VVFGVVRVTHLFSFLCCTLVIYVHRGIWWDRVTHLISFLCCVFGALCSPWYLVGSVLLICLVFYVVLWCFMFTVVFCGVRVVHLFSFLCCALVLYVHRGILWGPCCSSV
jgi:hypothetical protein